MPLPAPLAVLVRHPHGQGAWQWHPWHQWCSAAVQGLPPPPPNNAAEVIAMTWSFPTVLGLLLVASVGCSFAAGGNLLDNGDFEQGSRSWSLGNGWYEKPAGAGLSEMAVVDREGRNGGKALKIVGGGKRGLAMQVCNVYPGKYRVTGWIKCE
ncbi:MAG: hypothetical protein WCP21_15510, partial [Armatimonadota bacterium]